jgi:hypothetical protein
MRCRSALAAVEVGTVLVDVVLGAAAHQLVELALVEAAQLGAEAAFAHLDALHDRFVELARRFSGVAFSAETCELALIMPQPMSKPTGPIATAPQCASVKITQPTGTP